MTIWIRRKDQEYRPYEDSDLVFEPEFPVFQILPQETAFQQNQRWKASHESLAKRQHDWVLHQVGKEFSLALQASWYLAIADAITRESLTTHLNGVMQSTQMVLHLAQGRIVCDSSLNPLSVVSNNGIVIRVDYQFSSSFLTNSAYMTNIPL